MTVTVPLRTRRPLRPSATLRLGGAGIALLALTACSGPFDLDMRGRMGGSLDTSQAAVAATAPPPSPDSRGVLSYPNYQVAVARRGDTLASLANRIGLSPQELAIYNGIQPGDPLRTGEVVALPRRVATATIAGTAPVAPAAAPVGAITPAGAIDITTLAGAAIDRAPVPQASVGPAPVAQHAGISPGGVEPVRHQVQRGETAFTIARLYNVTPRALADWNGLGSDYALRDGQYLLIPTALSDTQRTAAAPVVAETIAAPGIGSTTPVPPSASKPLPDATPAVAAAPAPAVPKPDIGQPSAPAASSSAAMGYPVQGSIIREYSKGRNDGIDIGAPAGTAVKAAASGTVAAITTNTENIPIVVIKHPNNLLTVYTHIDGLSVQKGDAVSRGQTIGKVRAGDPPRMHFEVRNGFDSVDPMKYLK